jgi:hypothetical protein
MSPSFKVPMIVVMVMLVLSIVPGAEAQAAALDLQGYECMALNLSAEQMMDPSRHVAILKSPSVRATITGNAIATVIVYSPEQIQNGYLKVLQLNGNSGWVAAKYLKPWTNPGGNGQSCYPAILSNGGFGFDYH